MEEVRGAMGRTSSDSSSSGTANEPSVNPPPTSRPHRNGQTWPSGSEQATVMPLSGRTGKGGSRLSAKCMTRRTHGRASVAGHGCPNQTPAHRPNPRAGYGDRRSPGSDVPALQRLRQTVSPGPEIRSRRGPTMSWTKSPRVLPPRPREDPHHRSSARSRSLPRRCGHRTGPCSPRRTVCTGRLIRSQAAERTVRRWSSPAPGLRRSPWPHRRFGRRRTAGSTTTVRTSRNPSNTVSKASEVMMQPPMLSPTRASPSWPG